MDKTTPFFSIVMPVYGVADYLEQTLQSVAAQTFDDFEVILVMTVRRMILRKFAMRGSKKTSV